MLLPTGRPGVAYHAADDVVAGGVRTICVTPRDISRMVNLDLDADDRIVGLEILDASKLRPIELLPR